MMTQPRRHLKVGAGLWVPWFDAHEHANGTVTYSGLIFEFFDVIAKKMNFTYSVSTPADKEWARLLPNGSYTGIVGMCQRREVDMILGPVAPTWDRSKAADFSVPIYTDYYKIFLPRPRVKNDLSSITRPFAWEVWSAFGLALFLSIVLAIFINFFMKREVDHNRRRDMKIEPAFLLRIISTEAIKTLPSADGARLFLVTWMLGGFILQSAYSGVLTSILAVPKKAKSGLAKTVVDKTSFVYYSYEARNRVKDEGVAVLTDVFTMKSMMSEDFSMTGDCNYYIAREHIGQLLLSFGFPKGSDLIPHFNKWLTILKEAGIIENILKGATANATACLVKPGNEKVTSHLVFSIVDLAGTFLVLAGGAVAGFSALIFERLMYRQEFEENI